MGWVTAVVGLIGAWGLLAGVVLLGREARTVTRNGERAGDDARRVSLETGLRILVGVTLVFAGTVIVYISLALGGFVAPF